MISSIKKYKTINNNLSNFWIIKDNPIDKKAIIYKNNVDKNTSKTVEEIKVKEIKYLNLWPSSPLSSGDKNFPYTWKKGNTILLQKNKESFIIIYNEIYEFKLQKGDKPVKFMSPIVDNDTPYPYLIGCKYIYFLYENGNYFDYVFKEDINLNDDVISQHLGINKFRDNPRIKRHRFIAKKLYTPCNCKWAYKTNCSDNKCTKI